MAKRGHRENTDPHVLVTWVKQIASAMWADRGSGAISFTIRTSRRGSITALVASLAAPSCSPSAEADGVSALCHALVHLHKCCTKGFRVATITPGSRAFDVWHGSESDVAPIRKTVPDSQCYVGRTRQDDAESGPF